MFELTVVRPFFDMVNLLKSAFSLRVDEAISLGSRVWVSISFPIIGSSSFFVIWIYCELFAESVEFRSKPRIERCGWTDVVVYIAGGGLRGGLRGGLLWVGRFYVFIDEYLFKFLLSICDS